MKQLLLIHLLCLCCMAANAQYRSPSLNRGLDADNKDALPAGFSKISYPDKWKSVSESTDKKFADSYIFEKGCSWLGLGTIYNMKDETVGGTVEYAYSISNYWRIGAEAEFAFLKYDLSKNTLSANIQYLTAINNRTCFFPFAGAAYCIFSEYRNSECGNDSKTMATAGGNMGFGLLCCTSSQMAFCLKASYLYTKAFNDMSLSLSIMVSPMNKKEHDRYNRIFIEEYWKDPL